MDCETNTCDHLTLTISTMITNARLLMRYSFLRNQFYKNLNFSNSCILLYKKMVTMVCVCIESVSSVEGGPKGMRRRRLRRSRQRSSTPTNNQKGNHVKLKNLI